MVFLSSEEMIQLIKLNELNTSDAVKLLEDITRRIKSENRPFCRIFCKYSDSGKMGTIIESLYSKNISFDKICLYTRSKNEQLVYYLNKLFPDRKLFEVHEGLTHLKSVDIETHYTGNTLIIFNDLSTERCVNGEDRKMVELYLRG